MQDRTPDPAELDPIERASIDELQALQLERLQTMLREAQPKLLKTATHVDGVKQESSERWSC